MFRNLRTRDIRLKQSVLLSDSSSTWLRNTAIYVFEIFKWYFLLNHSSRKETDNDFWIRWYQSVGLTKSHYHFWIQKKRSKWRHFLFSYLVCVVCSAKDRVPPRKFRYQGKWKWTCVCLSKYSLEFRVFICSFFLCSFRSTRISSDNLSY